ncbi:MAG: insulinase family protein [Sphingomicrobium sp.]
MGNLNDMTTKHRSLLLLAAACAALLPLAPAAAQQGAQKANGWGVALTDVTPDPAIRYGRLPNGMRYAIMRNALPKDGAALRLQFEFGSIGEAENERGLAHFIEHMAFNGSTNVPEGEMVKILERQGLKFGPDTNAATGFDTTTYMLDLPHAGGETLDTAMMLMREVAGEVKFDPKAVDRERGVILGERRSRDTFQLHQAEDQIGFQLPATPYPTRFPIGTETVLKTATATAMRDLYHRYYRPENATLVFVGDADPAVIEQKVRATFSSWKGVGKAGTPLPRGTVDLKRSTQFDTFVDPASATVVTTVAYRPWDNPLDTLASRRDSLIRSLAVAAFNRRIERLANAPGSVLLGGGMNDGETKDAALDTSLSIAAKDGAWKDALVTSEQELRRALDHGFTAAELDLQRTDTIGRLKASVQQANARTSQGLASAILQVVGEPDFVTTPAFRLAYYERVAPTVTPAEVNAAFRTMWSGSAPLIHVAGKQPVDTAALAAAYGESRKLAVAAPKAQAAVAFAYDNFGPAGRVVEDKVIADLGIRTIRFANNVRLNIKRTDFEAGRVSYTMRMAGGGLALPRDRPGLSMLISALSPIAATAKHSFDDIRTISAGHVLTPGIAVSSNAIVAAGSTTVGDFPLQMKLSAAYLTDPGYREEAGSQWLNLVPVLDKQFQSDPSSVAGTRLPSVLASDDQRFGIAPTAELLKRNLGEAKTVLTPLIASAPIEIGIVGDIDEAAAIAAVASSFGALPTRAKTAPSYAEARKAIFRADRSPILLTHAGGADQAMVGAAWPTTDDRDYRTVIGMELLKDVADLLLTDKIREELGASYGVSVASSMSDTYPGFGYMMVSSVVAPDKADEVDDAIKAVAATLRSTPVSADLLARARQPMIEAATKSLRQNAYWLGYVDEAQTEPERLDRARTRDSIIRSITAADLQKLATTYLRDDKLQRVRIVSDKITGKTAATK